VSWKKLMPFKVSKTVKTLVIKSLFCLLPYSIWSKVRGTVKQIRHNSITLLTSK